MRVLVTGANGFVGSHAIEALSQNSALQLVAAVRDRQKIPPGFTGEIIEGDIRDKAYLEKLLIDVDVLVNAAAWSSVWGHAKQSQKYFLKPSLDFLSMAVDSGVKKIINLSSTSVAAPDASADPMSVGIKRNRWPHLDNVVEIENFLRAKASDSLTVMNLRFGIYTGERYGLGILPILLPRLRTHLVPWVVGGKTTLPIIDACDIGNAVKLAVEDTALRAYQSFNIVGPSRPTVRELIEYLHEHFNYPTPHFSVPFSIAYRFAGLMEKLDPLVPWEPLVTRSIVHLLEETHADNQRAEKLLGYKPTVHWEQAVSRQVAAMNRTQLRPMPMTKPIVD